VGGYLAEFVAERIAKYRLLAQEARNAALNAQSQEAIDMHMAMATAWPEGNCILQPRRRLRSGSDDGCAATEAGNVVSGLTSDVSGL